METDTVTVEEAPKQTITPEELAELQEIDRALGQDYLTLGQLEAQKHNLQRMIDAAKVQLDENVRKSERHTNFLWKKYALTPTHKVDKSNGQIIGP